MELSSQIGKGFPDSSFGKESACNARRPGFNAWVGKIHWRRDRLPGLSYDYEILASII